MSIRIVVGANWGDEGKGRMIDYFAQTADYVVRYQGGNNAGHTVVNDLGEFKMHLIPSGVFNPNVINVIGTDCVINLEALLSEVDGLRKRGIDVGPFNLKISNRACICFPYHKLQDEYEEERLGCKQFGSTKQGIGPVYCDKYLKYGIQIGALKDMEYFRSQLERCIELKNLTFSGVYKKPAISIEETLEWANSQREAILPYLVDIIEFFDNVDSEKKSILFEAQLGTLRDVHYGIYPFTTSSCTLSHFVPIGAGFFKRGDVDILAVVKSFSTCVGEGPFVTEMEPAQASTLRETAFEYGAATGRPRRIGHFDAVASRYGVKCQGATEIALTKLDSLSGLRELKICTSYSVNGVNTDRFPILSDLEKAQPVYETVPGWDEDVRQIRSFDKLPQNAIDYVLRIERLMGVKIKFVSVGPERESLIVRDDG